MSPPELLDALLSLAHELDLEVRRVAPGDTQTSGICRLHGRVWVLLSAGDPIEQQVAVVAAALRDHAGDACESRYLPPAVREVLEIEAGSRA